MHKFFNYQIHHSVQDFTLFVSSLTMARQISILLAQSFFMGFSVTITGLLARLRVLIQQVGTVHILRVI